MKKFFLLLVMGVSMMFATNASAQGYLKVNPLGLAFGQLGASYEGVLNEKSSFEVGANFYNRKFVGVKTTGFGASLQYRFYLSSDDAPRGLFVAPLVGANFLKYGYTDATGTGIGASDFNYTLITVGALIGYQWLFSDDRFSFEIGIGPAYRIATGDFGDGVSNLGTGVWPTGSLSLGYRLVE